MDLQDSLPRSWRLGKRGIFRSVFDCRQQGQAPRHSFKVLKHCKRIFCLLLAHLVVELSFSSPSRLPNISSVRSEKSCRARSRDDLILKFGRRPQIQSWFVQVWIIYSLATAPRSKQVSTNLEPNEQESKQKHRSLQLTNPSKILLFQANVRDGYNHGRDRGGHGEDSGKLLVSKKCRWERSAKKSGGNSEGDFLAGRLRNSQAVNQDSQDQPLPELLPACGRGRPRTRIKRRFFWRKVQTVLLCIAVWRSPGWSVPLVRGKMRQATQVGSTGIITPSLGVTHLLILTLYKLNI